MHHAARRLPRPAAFALAALLLVPLGCGTTHLVAPPGRTVRILGEDEPASVRVQRTVWYWMWGVPGAILAVPIMAVTKIVCDRVGPLNPFGHFLSG